MTKEPFRVLQLIDSLNPGGSERMAVQLANALSELTTYASLISTRKTGSLKQDISPLVDYTFLNRKKRLDFSAVKRLHAFIKLNKIDIVHAHGTSFFIASVVKLLNPKLKLIWHDHYGFRYQTKGRDNLGLLICSAMFSHTICINSKLSDWAKSHLLCKNISCIANFSVKPESAQHNNIRLKGPDNSFKIIHVANLRPEKDHLTALKAIKILLQKGFKITYHSIGGIDSSSSYFNSIKNYIDTNELQKSVFLYDSQTDVYAHLDQADLGLLSSSSEGFPVSLIEYGCAGLPVVVTDVGDCRKITGEYGSVIDPGDFYQLARALEKHITEKEWSEQKAKDLSIRINKTYNHELVLKKILDIYTKVKN